MSAWTLEAQRDIRVAALVRLIQTAVARKEDQQQAKANEQGQKAMLGLGRCRLTIWNLKSQISNPCPENATEGTENTEENC